MKFIHDIEKATYENEPTIGSLDESRCLPGWIRTFCRLVDQRKGFVMSADAVRALCHTLIAAKYRVNRLIREREAYKKAYEDLCNQTSTVVGNPLQVHCEHQVPKGEEKPKIDADQ